MAKRVQLMTNTKEWQTVDGVEVLIDVPQEDLDPITDSSCVEIEDHRTLEETISQENMFTPEIVETKVHSKVGGVYHDNVVDGAYEEAILYGNTQVNLVESVTAGTKYIPHSFTSFQGNESKIGNYHNGRTNQVAPLVKGVTMVNLVPQGNMTLKGGVALSVYNIKGGTEYTLKFTFTQKNNMAGIVIQSFKDENGTLTYLENSKLQSGLGDEVAITFTAHEQANIVHICNGSEYGGETIQLDNIMVIEGDVTDLDLPFFKGMRSVELSRPLTNLFTDDLVHYNANTSSTNTNGNITTTSTGVSSWNGTDYYLKNLKPHTKYIVMWDSLTTTQTSTTQQEILICAVCIVGNSRLGGINEDAKCPTLRSIIFDTGDKPLNEIAIRIHASMSNSEATATTVKGLRVFEWDDSLRTLDLQTIGYFSGTKYVSTRALETEGKNLYPYGDINFTPTQVQWHDAKGTNYMYGDIAQKSKCRFLLKKGTYKLSSDYNNRTNLGYMALVTDKEETMEDTTFTLEEDTYLTLRLQPVEANVPTTLTNIQIERGETVTSYEAYFGRYYKPRETEKIILRSLPNGVCDTFNLQTGELVQRVGEIVLDGSEYFDTTESHFWYINLNISNENYMTFMLDGRDGIPSSSNFICDKLPNKPSWLTVQTGVWADSAIVLTLPTSIATTVLQLKEYLQTNQLRIQYELKEPIITKLQIYDRVYNGQTNTLAGMGNNISALTYLYSTDYLKVGNLSPVPAILEPITSVPYDVRLKPSTLYTVKYNRGGYSNSMKFDLGGSVVEKTNATTLGIVAEEFTVRTPAILSHEQIRLSGTGYANNFIVVEGDITGTELPYFEGMKDVKMPIVKNIGKNLFHGGFELGTMSSTTGEYTDVTTAIRATDYTKVMGGKQYVFYCDDLYYKFAYVQYDKNKKFLRTSGGYVSGAVITLQPDVEYVIMRTPDGQSPLMNNTHVKLALYEYEEGMDTTLQDYKENSVYAVQGEYPITSEMIEQGGFSTSLGSTYEDMKYDNAARLRSKDLIPVKPNTTYAFAHSFSKFAYNVYQWNGNEKFIDGASQYFASGQIETITTTADTQYIHFLMSKYNANETITVAEYDWSQFHMYELDSTINLRSLPNGVKDELNLLTGEYIQRVGEVVFDGSEDEMWTTASDNTGGAFRFETLLLSGKFNGVTYDKEVPALLCDKYATYKFYDIYRGNAVGITFYYSSHIVIYDNKYTDLASFKQALQSNPITLQYELKEPIISHVRLVSNNQEREVGVKLPYGVSNTYNPSTGITTVRVGKVVLDGSEEYSLHNKSAQTTVWYTSNPLPNVMNFSANTSVVAEGINAPYPPKSLENQTQEVCYISSSGKFNFTLLNTKASTVNELKTYLASNPITVWYELKYPQIQPDIVLPNGVHDEYNPETGVYTKKVGFAEFDGSADEGWRAAQTDPSRFVCEILTDRKYYSSDVIKDCMLCDKITVVSYKELYGTDGTDGVYGIAPFGSSANIQMRLEGITTAEQLQQYLSQNPIKLWYELATPITYKLTPYLGLPQPYAYEDGYLIHESAYPETTLPPEFKYKLVANRTGQIVQNGRKLQEHTTRLSNLEALIIEATIESLFNRELQLFELELMDIQLIDLGE